MSTRYSGLPDGLPGNDDYGTMSAWYMFASLGFYPQAGSTNYIVPNPKRFLKNEFANNY
jgi:putative alpha-1,2-mannosidase